MKQELDEALCAKYPLVFRDRRAPMTQTAMCWGFSCGDGWYHIIDTLCGLLTSNYRSAKDSYDSLVQWKAETGRHPWRDGKEITDEDIQNAKLNMEEEAERVPVAVQVKEKFGGLRFYVDRASEKHYNYINFAENISHRTCEECGSPGMTYTMGWHRTLCEKHADEAYGEEAAEYRNKTGQWSDEYEI